MKTKSILIGIALFAASIAIIFTIIGVSANNQEEILRSKLTAQKEVCEAHYDKLWKVISQKAQVADQYKSAFKEIYPALIEGRYGNEQGGTLMKWVQESNPSFDISLYKDLMASIEAERAGFFMEQKYLTDLNNQHRIIRHTWPKSMFIGSRPDIQIVVVSSSATKKVMETGEENDIQIFKPKS